MKIIEQNNSQFSTKLPGTTAGDGQRCGELSNDQNRSGQTATSGGEV